MGKAPPPDGVGLSFGRNRLRNTPHVHFSVLFPIYYWAYKNKEPGFDIFTGGAKISVFLFLSFFACFYEFSRVGNNQTGSQDWRFRG